MGGIPTNADGEVQRSTGEIVPGLFAIGECACASFHGFNRLGTNSLVELLVMGKVVGECILSYLKDGRIADPAGAGEQTLSRFSGYLAARGTENTGKIRLEMRYMMTKKVGVFRNEQGVQEAVAALEEYHRRSAGASIAIQGLRMNQELLERWELDNLLDVAMVIAQGALMRRESRGAHFREDFPERSDAFQFHNIESMTEFGKVLFARRSVDMSLQTAGGADSDHFKVIPRKY
jgi:succinate dehydrogenase / fumarate reductase flavoprotein subunit